MDDLIMFLSFIFITNQSIPPKNINLRSHSNILRATYFKQQVCFSSLQKDRKQPCKVQIEVWVKQHHLADGRYQSELLVGCRPSSAIILRNLHSLGDSLKNMKIEKFNLQHMGWLQIIEGKSSFKFFLLNSLSCYKDKQQRQRMNFSFIRMDQSIHFI